MEGLEDLNKSLERAARLPEEIPPLKCSAEIERIEEMRTKAVNIFLDERGFQVRVQ